LNLKLIAAFAVVQLHWLQSYCWQRQVDRRSGALNTLSPHPEFFTGGGLTLRLDITHVWF